ncbi:hypothetical protein LINPERHAP2_LOCUS15947 [Linum perenne]
MIIKGQLSEGRGRSMISISRSLGGHPSLMRISH